MAPLGYKPLVVAKAGGHTAGSIMSRFARFILNSPTRVAMPIAVYPGAALTGATVRDVVTHPEAQRAASAAVHERFQTPFALTAMDLSAEAEAFGAEVVMSDHEIPTVVGRIVASLSEAQSLPVPRPGDRRTQVHLAATKRLKQLPTKPMVLGGCIGPFSLAARLAGVSEAMELTLSEPDLMHTLLEKSTEFLTAYALAFRAAGADAVIMAEPGAGLLSPRGMATFSSSYIRRIVAAVEDGNFTLILHNCAAKLLHLAAVLESGAKVCHFGAPMDMVAALGKVDAETVLCGNLDPSATFCQATPPEMAQKTQTLLTATTAHRNFVISSGCDVPSPAPIENLDAFFKAAQSR